MVVERLPNTFGFKAINCSSGGGGGGGGGCLAYTISPNPAQGTLHIIPNIPAPCDPPPPSVITNSETSKTFTGTSGKQRSISKVEIYDNYGNLKKSQVENNAKQVSLNLTGFKTGVYVVIISDGAYKERQQIIIQ